jgi:hypothetical protein
MVYTTMVVIVAIVSSGLSTGCGGVVGGGATAAAAAALQLGDHAAPKGAGERVLGITVIRGGRTLIRTISGR